MSFTGTDGRAWPDDNTRHRVPLQRRWVRSALVTNRILTSTIVIPPRPVWIDIMRDTPCVISRPHDGRRGRAETELLGPLSGRVPGADLGQSSAKQPVGPVR
jgi:hypothetical protein